MTWASHQDGLLPPPSEGAGKRWVFVFGSNMAGRHGAGAAKIAAQYFGAERGVGEGETGDAYALPTKDHRITTLPLASIKDAVEVFLGWARRHPNDMFFVTRVGCGLAGYTDAEIAPMFKDAPSNCSFAEGWREWLGANSFQKKAAKEQNT